MGAVELMLDFHGNVVAERTRDAFERLTRAARRRAEHQVDRCQLATQMLCHELCGVAASSIERTVVVR